MSNNITTVPLYVNPTTMSMTSSATGAALDLEGATLFERWATCAASSDALIGNHYTEVAMFFALALGFFGVVGVWARATYGKKTSDEYVARISSLTHAISATSIAAAIVTHRAMNGDAYDAPTTCQEGMAQSWTVAYFTIDLLGILAQDKIDWLFIAHHLSSCAVLMWAMVTGEAGHLITLLLMSLEMTNPLMQTHWFHVADARVRDAWFQFNRFGFIAAFTIVRGIFGPWLLYVCWSINLPWYLITVGAIFFILSINVLVDIARSELRGKDDWTV